MKKLILVLLTAFIISCSSVQTDETEEPFVLGKEVKMHGCEEWKKREPEKYDC